MAFTCEAKVSDCSVLAVSLSRNRRDESPAPPPPIGAVGKARCPLRNLHFSFSFSPEPSPLAKVNTSQSRRNCHAMRCITPLFICATATHHVSALSLFGFQTYCSGEKVLNQIKAALTKMFTMETVNCTKSRVLPVATCHYNCSSSMRNQAFMI